ncbi:hypothetical protein [Suttonella ornithocola]|uniref:Uncharacterized protein n=1 Tax=Suttonella ornithocola TaxID=279832 RepID=A0A380MWS3_9GAMM|nr:hypothetical protein [Suttonella ornithocola]SUO96161.1 Uncharacterised protein [Suttonella ornithocola]
MNEVYLSNEKIRLANAILSALSIAEECSDREMRKDEKVTLIEFVKDTVTEAIIQIEDEQANNRKEKL